MNITVILLDFLFGNSVFLHLRLILSLFRSRSGELDLFIHCESLQTHFRVNSTQNFSQKILHGIFHKKNTDSYRPQTLER